MTLEEKDIPVRLNVAKAMFDEHVRIGGFDRDNSEGHWMLEESLRHYWTHLAAAAIRELGNTPAHMTPSDTIALAKCDVEGYEDPVVMAFGTEEAASDYAASMIAEDGGHYFLLMADGRPLE